MKNETRRLTTCRRLIAGRVPLTEMTEIFKPVFTRSSRAILNNGTCTRPTVIESPATASRRVGGGKSVLQFICGFFEQLLELIFPQRRERVTAMSAGLLAQRNYDDATAGDALDLALKNAELRRVDQVVGVNDSHQRSANFLLI